MSRSKILLIFSIVSGVVVLGSLALKIFAPDFVSQQLISQFNLIDNYSGKTSSTLPISLDNQAVRFALITYTLKGTLKEIKKIPEGLELITDIKGESIPKLIVTKDTNVVFSNGRLTQASSDDLSEGQELSIRVRHNLEKKTWTTVKVYILVE